MQGKLIGIARKGAPRAAMEQIDTATITVETGISGDHRGKLRRRQITVMALADWQAACAEIDRSDLHWTTRRANLLVSGVTLPQNPGQKIRMGDVILEITGETDPCKRMEDAASGLMAALTPDWRGGVTCRVVQGGIIHTDSYVTIE